MQAWEELKSTNYLVQAFSEAGLFVFDLENPLFQWMDDERSPRPGIVPFEDAPGLVTSDYVFNANDNYWLSNIETPIEEASFMYGAIETPRSPRTRMNGLYLSADGEDSTAGLDGRFSLVELQETALDSGSITAVMLKDLVVERCLASPMVQVDDREVDLSEACGVLAAWDGKAQVDSVGAHIWREFIANDGYGWADLTEVGLLYGQPFVVTDPVGTPSGLAPAVVGGFDSVLEGLGRGVLLLEDNGFALDTPLGDIQFYRKGEHQFSVPGASDAEGSIAIVRYGGSNGSLVPFTEREDVVHGYTDLAIDGYQVNDGNSWVMTMEFTEDGPNAEALLLYSQSEDPNSPHFVDQSDLYSRGEFRACLFDEAMIAADPNLTTLRLTREAD
jgi:acyl-homoserine-lactone acylase